MEATMRYDPTLTRRGFAGALLGTLALPGLPALAKAPAAGVQAPGLYRQGVGSFEVTVINDGWLPLETKIFMGDQAKAGAMLDAAFLPKDATKTSVNEWLINTGDRLVLVDTGTSDVFGRTLGRMAANLAAAGVDPKDVDVVILTHLHPDHAAGLLTHEKAIAFPNATVHVHEAEDAFWSDEAIYGKAPAEVKPFFDIARASVKPYREAGRIQHFKGGSEIVPGIAAVDAPGHTMGHTMLRVSSGGQELLIVTDIVHNAALQFANPEWSIAFDTDPAMAAKSRKLALDMASADRLQIAGAHLPFPGLGHVARTGTAYAYVPTPWAADL
jgi:glyoxylase-like metal-dependent hydrolase (beta-lactamase superfamily II)